MKRAPEGMHREHQKLHAGGLPEAFARRLVPALDIG